MGYLVNHPCGLLGSQGIGYDYVLGAGGLYVQSESAHLAARVLLVPCEVRGLQPVYEKVALSHGPIPANLFELGLRWLRTDPDTERFFAVCWDGEVYQLVVPPQAGTSTSVAYRPPPGWSPSSTPTEAPAPSSRIPTTGTSRASASTASSGASIPPGPS